MEVSLKPSFKEAFSLFFVGKRALLEKILEDIEAFSPLSLKVTYELMKEHEMHHFKN